MYQSMTIGYNRLQDTILLKLLQVSLYVKQDAKEINKICAFNIFVLCSIRILCYILLPARLKLLLEILKSHLVCFDFQSIF